MLTAFKNQNYEVISICQIPPDIPLPFGLYFYFRGKYIEVVKKGHILSIQIIAKSMLEENYFAYIKVEERASWLEWEYNKRFENFMGAIARPEENRDSIKRKIKFFQLGTMSCRFRNSRVKDQAIIEESQALFRDLISHSAMNSFFNLDIDEKVIKHTSRVTYLIILFINCHTELVSVDEAKDMIHSSIIHEIKWSDSESVVSDVHRLTVDLLKKNKIIVPEKIAKCLYWHDELYSGKGIPGELKGEAMEMPLRIFSVIDRFDHLYLRTHLGQSRKQRMEKTLELYLLQQEHFDPTVFEYFVKFVNNIEYVL